VTVWTIGHSTRSLEEFLHLLSLHRIEVVADVRRFPGSRRWPQFDRKPLGRALDAAGISYVWLPLLGGRRRPSPDSPAGFWRNAMFRGYAEYTLTESFAEGLWQLQILAGGLRTCLMCAEAVWWRCHRRLIADVLRSQGCRVRHVMSATSAVSHPNPTVAATRGWR